MKPWCSHSRMPFGIFITVALVFNSLLVCPARAQERTIVITVDQPNLWTLEQAHYLLAQMHRRNLDLKAKGLGELDPNEINGLRFDVLRSLIEFGATFNQADLVNNRLRSQNMTFDAERRQSVIRQRDQLRSESLSLTRNITRLQGERAQAAGQEEQARLDAEIERQTVLRASVDKEVEFADNELKTLNAPSGELTPTEGAATFDPSKLPKSIFDDAFKSAAGKLIEDFNKAPKLNASLMLDNFLQMQYEILSKQLTLLRDEVGPGERVVFLELPQSLNATHDKADKKWAQSWWKIVGYTAPLKAKLRDISSEAQTGEGATRLTNQMDRYGEMKVEAAVKDRADKKDEIVTQEPTRETRDIIEDAYRAVTNSGHVHNNTKFHDLRYFLRDDSQGSQTEEPKKTGAPELKPENRSVRAIELIPRQGSLNVNDMQLRVRSGALTAVARTLFGFGAGLNIQRQRESFSQFVQQELYSSGFGKGSREFGWTFTPMPGTNRILPGTRTTYAVLVVPAEAEALVLHSTGCYFPRNEYQPLSFDNTRDERWTDEDRRSRNCAQHKAFIVPIPGGGQLNQSDFWVDRLDYEQVKKGGRVVLSIRGKNFSSQMGILIDGVPLTQAIGVAQPLIRDDSATGAATARDIKEEKIRGRIERIDNNQMIAVFERVDDKEDTPIITLTAPGKARNLNDLQLRINGTLTSLNNNPDKMFGRTDPPRPRRIDKVELFRSPTKGNLRAMISGGGFTVDQHILVNGIDLGPLANGAGAGPNAYISAGLLLADFQAPLDEIIQITLLDPAGPPIKGMPVANPAHLRINNVTLLSYEKAGKNSPAVLVAKIEGTGFNDGLKSSVGELVVKSVTEAVLKLKDPESVTVVTLTDPTTGSSVKTIITRKNSSKEE